MDKFKSCLILILLFISTEIIAQSGKFTTLKYEFIGRVDNTSTLSEPVAYNVENTPVMLTLEANSYYITAVGIPMVAVNNVEHKFQYSELLKRSLDCYIDKEVILMVDYAGECAWLMFSDGENYLIFN